MPYLANVTETIITSLVNGTTLERTTSVMNGTATTLLVATAEDWKPLLVTVADTANAASNVVHVVLKAYHIWVELKQLRALHHIAHGDLEDRPSVVATGSAAQSEGTVARM